jgi:hypothetical protein
MYRPLCCQERLRNSKGLSLTLSPQIEEKSTSLWDLRRAKLLTLSSSACRERQQLEQRMTMEQMESQVPPLHYLLQAAKLCPGTFLSPSDLGHGDWPYTCSPWVFLDSL